ncbi:MAG TPA: hypothetical protein VKX46_20230, partial [Ktedonobacteraceae bacterium]|nr:hypothetical protein [Ktedonobacteraceae bacterium]
LVAFLTNTLQEVLYVILFLLALLLVAATLFQIYSIVMVLRAVKTVRDEMKPLVSSVQETVEIVKDTAQTAGHTVNTIGETVRLTGNVALGPSVRAVSAVVAAREMVRVFFGQGHVRTRAEQRRKQQLEAIQANAGAGGGE